MAARDISDALLRPGRRLSTYQDDHAYLTPLRPAMYFYVAPARNPGVEAVYVDRVVLIREKDERAPAR